MSALTPDEVSCIYRIVCHLCDEELFTMLGLVSRLLDGCCGCQMRQIADGVRREAYPPVGRTGVGAAVRKGSR